MERENESDPAKDEHRRAGNHHAGEEPEQGIEEDRPPAATGVNDGEAVDPAEADISFRDFENTPSILMKVGEFGVYLAYVGLGVAILGLVLATIGFRILANVALTLSFLLVTVALLIGVIFQMYTSGFPVPGRGD